MSDAQAPAREQRMPHLPGLDGLRGLAVIGVLLFHGGFAWAEGGFLGVSTFFTLSGFLITNLLVREFDGRHDIDLVRFWGRRFRRLMPAAIVTIAVIGIVWWIIGTPTQLSSLRGDMLASLGYVANWRFLSAGTSYADLFSAPTPLQHYWSLAIEEQFYVVFPLVALLTMRVGGRRLLTAVCSIAAIGSVALMVANRNDFDRIYYGTDTRVAELLFGVLLAIWWSGRQRRRALAAIDEPRRQSRSVDALGLVALVAMFWTWWAIPEASRLLARGGLPLYAVGTTVIIYAATREGLVTRLLSMSWLRWAGLISYGLYLYHWPVFLWLSPERVHLSTGPLFAVRMIVTIAIAMVSYHLLEMPIRRGTLLRTWRTAVPAAIGGLLAVSVCAFAVTLHPPASTVPYASAKVGEDRTFVEEGGPAGTGAASGQTVWIIGDSGAMDLQPALGAALRSAGASKIIYGAGPGFALSPPDNPWRSLWNGTVANDDPDLVIVMFGGWDLDYVRANGWDAYDRLLDEAVSILSARGARIAWLPVLLGGKVDVDSFLALDRAFERLAARHPGVVVTTTTASALSGPDGTYPRMLTTDDGSRLLLRKADGWHLCQAGAERLATVIMDRLVAFGWSPAPTPGWETGGWRANRAYDDPVGACIMPR